MSCYVCIEGIKSIVPVTYDVGLCIVRFRRLRAVVGSEVRERTKVQLSRVFFILYTDFGDSDRLDIMKKHTLLLLLCLGLGTSLAQNPAVENALKSRYSLVQYHSECGGWYFISYQKNGQTLYGFTDKLGNVVVSDAFKYKLHKGYIELYLLDVQKKALHDQWKVDYRQYERDYQEYKRIEAKHDAEMSAYKAKLEIAHQEAERRWNVARENARRQAEAQVKAQQSQRSNLSGGWGIAAAVLGGISDGATIANAVNAVKFDDYYNQVKAERNLSVEPSKPYNPIPDKPVEPSDGYYWANYSLLQPCPYSFIDFEKISEVGGFADVCKDGLYGLVDSYMREVVPCANRNKVAKEWLGANRFKIYTNSGFGVIDKNGKSIIPCIYTEIETEGTKYRVRKGVNNARKYGLLDMNGNTIMPCIFEEMKNSEGYLLCKKNTLWGVYTNNYEELYPCQYQSLSFGRVGNNLILNTQDKGLWGVVDFNTGKPLLNNKFTAIQVVKSDNNESFFKVKKDNKEGLYSSKGVIILPCEYSDIVIKKLPVNMGEKEGIEVRKNGMVGLFTMQGLPIILPQKYKSYSMDFLFCEVEDNNGKKGICSVYGQELIPCAYTSLEYNYDLNGFIASLGDGFGLVSMTGDLIVPFVPCQGMSYRKGDDYLIINNGVWGKSFGAVTFDGVVIIPPKIEYEKIVKRIERIKKKKAILFAGKDTKIEMLKTSRTQFYLLLGKTSKERNAFSFFAQNYVERVVNDWQHRGEFEKKDVWEKRVNAETRKQKVYELTKEAQNTYIENHAKNLPADKIEIIGQYDPDNETYRIKTKYAKKDILVKVAPEDALEFKSTFTTLRKIPTYFIEDDYLGLAEYTFEMTNGKRYKYSNQASLNYSIAQVEYNFDAITIDASASNKGFVGGKQTISTSGLILGTSDVDVAIPTTTTIQPKTFAIIIANENYQNEKNVEFAYNDGQVFKDYCIKALGIPMENVHFRANATLNDLRFEMNWIKQTATAYNGEAKFIVYYAGHGVPDDASKDAYLLPTDGFSSDLSSGYKLSDFYKVLGEIPSENVLVFLDACFSGAQRSGEIMASARGVAIKPKLTAPKGNLIVFSAATDRETAYPYKEKYHGLFTYYLLKKIKETPGNLTLGSLVSFVTGEVKKKSIVVNRKTQTPTLSASVSMNGLWENMSIK